MINRTIKIVLFAKLLLACGVALADTCSDIESRTSAHNFYVMLDKIKLFSVPKNAELEKLNPYITKDLFHKVNLAVLAEEKDFERSKGEEPPLYEGSLFSSLAEGYSNFYVSIATHEKETAKVDILLQYAQNFLPYYANKPGINEWKDQAIIKRDDGKCKVDNIIFGSDGVKITSLRDRLDTIISYTK